MLGAEGYLTATLICSVGFENGNAMIKMDIATKGPDIFIRSFDIKSRGYVRYMRNL